MRQLISHEPQHVLACVDGSVFSIIKVNKVHIDMFLRIFVQRSINTLRKRIDLGCMAGCGDNADP
jgi:hypothetical protein